MRKTICRFALLLCWLQAYAALPAYATDDSAPHSPPVKVAFMGDMGTGFGARAVLQLAANEGADLAVLLGDLGYDHGAAQRWQNLIDSTLGSDFPLLLVVGNHEDHEWPTYRSVLDDRVARHSDLACQGEAGVKSLCTFRGLAIVTAAPGIHEVAGVRAKDNYPEFIVDSLDAHPSPWRICAWHKNQAAMQIGGKGDQTGWGVYRACLEVGAMVATAHDHTYARTHLLSDFESRQVVHTRNHLELARGRSFAFVAGLGGRSIRTQTRFGPWWAATYSSRQGAMYGALFCSYAGTRAHCYFKDIAGGVPDVFTLSSRVGARPMATATQSVADEAPR